MKGYKKDLKPQMRFPEFRNAGKWDIKPLNEVFTRLTAKNTENNQNVLTISAQLGLVSQLKYFNKSVAAKDLTGYYLLHEGDFAYNKSYSNGYPMGAIKPLRMHEKGIVSTLYICFRIKKGFNGSFFEHYFETGLQNSEIQKIAKEGGRAHGLLNVGVKDFFEKINLFIPQKEEQRKIADCLSSINAVIVGQLQKVESLKEHKKGLIQQLFPRSQEEGPTHRFPEFKNSSDWEFRRLGDFISERNLPASDKIPLYSLTIEDGIAPKSQRYERSFLVKNEKEAYKVVKPNDFAYNPMNLRFGAIARHSGKGEVAISKYYNIFYCDDTVVPQFCEVYFTTAEMIAHYDNVATGSLIEKRRVHFSEFLKFMVRFPGKAEQQKIADCLSSLEELIVLHSDRLKSLKAHKKALMQQLFPHPEVEGI